MFKKNIIISIKLVMIFSFLINTLQYFIFAELTEITPISISTNDSTPEYGFNSDIETGNIIYGGSCGSGSLISISTTGTYTTIFNTLNDGEYNDCNLTISGITLNISPFTIDTTYPIITITNPDTTPALTKTITASTNEGTLKYAVNAIDDTTCNGTLTFRAYTAEIFTTEADNGKYICYKAIDEAENISYKLSDEIGGIDTTPPTATIQYTPAFDSRTNTDVITIITGFNETATGLNATGFTFTGNGTFPFTFEDLLGNTGEVIATVNRIDKPFNLELRGYVMLMMMRADQQFIKSSYNTFTPLRGSKTFIPGKTITIISGSSQFTETELDFIENANKNYQFNAGYTIGESDLGIKYLQYLLKSKIYYTGAINGINTNNTVTALYEFQFDNNIVNKATDQGAGYLGPSTRELLNPLLQTLLNP